MSRIRLIEFLNGIVISPPDRLAFVTTSKPRLAKTTHPPRTPPGSHMLRKGFVSRICG